MPLTIPPAVRPQPTMPFVVSYGLGVDSTAVLVGLVRAGVKPDAILFADVGDEKPETYAYLAVIDRYLAAHGFPPVTVVRYVPKKAHYLTLEQNCLVNHTLPSLAFGFKGCSLKWKKGPQEKWARSWAPARAAWAAGGKVIKAIGYDCGPQDSRRAWRMTDDKRYAYWYPLRDWQWDRERCKAEIAAEGLPVPPKSACFYCPSTKPDELRELAADHPDLARRIMALEANAKPYLKKIEGLWRKAVKGCRGATPKPGTMTEFLVKECGMAAVMDYDTAAQLTGKCSGGLVEASTEAAPTGAVLATLIEGMWQHVPPSAAESMRNQGREVRTVYVEQ